MPDRLGDRIKRYEAAYRRKLTPRSCVVVRVDGRAFHTFTRGCARPFDLRVVDAMEHATRQTSREMQGFRLAYTQSDEASFLLTDFESHETQGWFDYDHDKVVSIAASTFTAHFNDHYGCTAPLATFDGRAFVVPADDVPNVFLWRQRDWARNSLQMLARSVYNHNVLMGKNQAAVHEMLREADVCWADLAPRLRNGTFVLPDETAAHDKVGYDEIKEMAGL